MSAHTLPLRIPARRRSAWGIALTLYGGAGVLLLALLGAAAGPTLAGIDSLSRSGAQVATTLYTTRDAFDGFGVSVVEAQRSAERASVTARSSANSARQLASAMASVNILGAQPLIGIARGFEQQAQDLDLLGQELDLLASSLATNVDDVRAIREDVGALADRASAMSAPTATIPLAPLVYALLLWLLVSCLAIAWLGVTLWRT